MARTMTDGFFSVFVLLTVAMVAWFQMEILVLGALVGLGVAVLVLRYPFYGYLGVILATWLDSINPFILTSGLTLNRFLVFITLGAIVGRIIVDRVHNRLKFTAFDGLFFVLVLTVGISVAVNGAGVRTEQQFSSLIIGYFYYWLAINVIKTRNQVLWLVGALVVATIPIAITTIEAGLTTTTGIRFSGIQSLADTAAQTAIAIPLVLLLLGAVDWRKLRIPTGIVFAAIFGLILIFGVTIFLSGTRAAVIALVVMMGVLALFATNQQRLWAILGIVMGGVVAYQAVWFVNPAVYERYELLDYASVDNFEDVITADDSFEARADVYERAIDAFESSPIIGIGFGNLFNWAGFSRSSHSVFFNTLGETGLMGFAALISIYLYCIWCLRRSWVLARNAQDRLLIVVVLTVFVGYNVVFASFSISELKRLMFMFFALPIVLYMGIFSPVAADETSQTLPASSA